MEEARGNASLNRESPVVEAMVDNRFANQVPRRNIDSFNRSPTLEAMELGHK